MTTKISICIPTYNRASCLLNCLNSIRIAKESCDTKFEVCVSDNGSTDNTLHIVEQAKKKMDIKYRRNSVNLGIPKNFIDVVEMASGEFAWLVGDDDLLLPDSIIRLSKLIDSNRAVDFFYLNSYNLNVKHISNSQQPFDTGKLPINMQKFSNWGKDGVYDFLDLVHPKVSFDFLGGMFLSAFRRNLWLKNVHFISESAIKDLRTFSHFDNTFPHLKVFANAFSKSKAYYNSEPLIVSLFGVREWAPMEAFIRCVRLVESVDLYRKNGLPFLKYLYCKNFALRNFFSQFFFILLNKDISGYEYMKKRRVLTNYCIYPNFYLSSFYFLFRKTLVFFKSFFFSW